MSFIIQGIDLPKKGDILTLDIYSDGTGYASHEGEADTMDAKAIQIPKGHGNIKDEKVLAEIMGKVLGKIANEKESISKSARLSLIRDLAIKFDAAPTILKGE